MDSTPAEAAQAGRRNEFGTFQDPEFAEQFGALIHVVRPDWPAAACAVAIEESAGDLLAVMRRAVDAANDAGATAADLLP